VENYTLFIPLEYRHRNVVALDSTALENALKRMGISKEFDEWFAIAKDR